MSFIVNANFLDVYKIGDNINYNLKVLAVLYDTYDSSADGRYLIKPIVLINAAITEAILYDFVVNRLKRPFFSEMLSLDIFKVLKDKELSKFEHYVTQAEKFDLFELKDTNFYNALRSLNKIRNRIHIQNDKWYEPHTEARAFNDKAKILSEKILEKILNTMTTKYPRREEYYEYVKDFELPWERHFPEPQAQESVATSSEKE